MKIRLNFVSNSSSTSFLLRTADDFAEFQRFFPHEGVIDVEQLRQDLRDICETEEKLKAKFADYSWWTHVIGIDEYPSWSELLNKLPQTGWITDAVDRDECSRVGYFHETFAEDL
jgi:hypothetical protein